ncbi:hypothetical protein DY000_02030422 [Brassica cretica]|uniref:F-box domain-containing protein n=1 Tax=Brassica cretica TaxID=69181 RepID=A0ABQ7DJT5_BRACR|nr:hypothetical protein DY000_02030422 [Brassica cretica]
MAASGERNRSQRKLKPETSSTGDNEDFISYLPDEILHHIISFNPTKLAAKTSVLSRRRWRHVWCETPCLSFLGVEAKVPGINQTIVSYRALKLTSFRLDIAYPVSARQIKFAMSRSKAAPGPGPETGTGAGTGNIKLKICRYGYGIETATIL